MRYKALALCTAVALALLVAGCAHEGEQAQRIEPLPAAQDTPSTDLGEGITPLSRGPGDKSSPTWSPSGDQFAYITDGYVNVGSPGSEEASRLTTRDFNARQIIWSDISGELLYVLGSDTDNDLPARQSGELSLYSTPSDTEGSLELDKVLKNTLTFASTSNKRALVAAYEKSSGTSGLAVINGTDSDPEKLPLSVEGTVTGLSISADNKKIVYSVRDESDVYSIHRYNYSSQQNTRLTTLAEGTEVFGAPQWTSRGIYYIAGDEDKPQGGDNLFSLYRLTERGGKQSASAVGKDFVASSLRASPDRQQLAILGRRSSGSATNLYRLNLKDGQLQTLTSNENMKLKTGRENIAWSPDGQHIIVVADSPSSEVATYNEPSENILEGFENLYEVPTG